MTYKSQVKELTAKYFFLAYIMALIRVCLNREVSVPMTFSAPEKDDSALIS